MGSEYRLLGRIETGDLAELFRAVRSERHPVVIKLFHKKTTALAYARAVGEISRSLKAVNGPGVVRPIDLGLTLERLAVVREDPGGSNLGTVLQRLTTKEVVLSIPLGLLFILDVLEVLGRAHEVGVVHGALTPGNVLLSDEGRAALSDFGALAALESVPALSRVFWAKGRRNYRSPEVLRGGRPSAASDIYSVGAILYELLTLREPMSDSREGTPGTRRGQIVPPGRIDRRINARLNGVVMRALEADPERRYKSAAELGAAIRDYFGTVGGLPSRDDLKRFANDLFPNEVSITRLGPVPVSDPFELVELDLGKSEVDSVAESELNSSERRSYTKDVPVTEGSFDPDVPETTEPSGSAVAEWHAPPGAAPKKARRLRAHEGDDETAINVPLKRVKLVEDFGGEDFKKDEPEDDHTVVPPPPKKDERSQTLADFRIRSWTTDESAKPAEPAKRWSPPSMSTLLTMTGMLGLLGLALFGAWNLVNPQAAVQSFGGPSEPIPNLRLEEEQRKNAPMVARQKQATPTSRVEERPKKPANEPFVVWHVPATGDDAAFLTIQADVQAYVFIDGHRVRSPTPLMDYAVTPGEHKIALVDPESGERRSFALRLSPGQSSRLEEMFGKKSEPR